jgi:hypothetical protein
MHVMRFCEDGGSDSTSKKFAECLKSEVIIKETTTTYSPQSNGVVEWANHNLIECLRCMTNAAELSKKYWAFARSVVVFLNNRTPKQSVVGNTVYESWHECTQLLMHLHLFGCLDFVHIQNRIPMKLDYRATAGIFIGYSISTKHYFVYDPFAMTHHLSRHVFFRQ